MNQKDHLQNALKANLRYDGRKSDQYRKLTVEREVVNTAEGSARVKLGNTELIVGVKMSIGTPYPDMPDEGTIMVGAELLPLSSSDYELGPPQDKAIELARVVDRGVRESKAIDMKKLCVTVGEKVWMVSIDICTINDDGNLFDAAGIGTLAALQGAVFPSYDGTKVDYKKRTSKKLELSKIPVPVTVYKVGKQLFVDPTDQEEKLMDARLTVTTTQDGTICALQKGGEAPLTIEEIGQMVDLALMKAKELRKHL